MVLMLAIFRVASAAAVSILSPATTFTASPSKPSGAVALDATPVGLSLEFFDFPSYFLNVSNTLPCIEELQSLSGKPPPIRIGGTTQDRAVYDPSLSDYVLYSVSGPSVAPSNLTFGPKFFDLAANYNGDVTIGLNRGYDNLNNTIMAAKAAVACIPAASLYAIELGNEPDLYLSQGQQIATDSGVWTPQLDAESEADWQAAVGRSIRRTNLIQAGNFVSGPPSWSAEELFANENGSALEYVRDFSHHNYPQGGSGADLKQLMNHSAIAANIAQYARDLPFASREGKEYVIGESNSVSGGGAATVSPTFGGALWVLDVTMRAASSGIKRLYFHFGTVGNCAYCWFGRGFVASPWYGGYVATAALAGARYIEALDDGSSLTGAYALYGEDQRLMRLVLYNSEYYAGSGTRAVQNITISYLEGCSQLQALRLTAPSALSRQDSGQNPTFSGQVFQNATCHAFGERKDEAVPVVDGQASILVSASEAVLINLLSH